MKDKSYLTSVPSYDTHKGMMFYRIRNMCGVLGVLLPYFALFSASLSEHPSPEWWWSISATYYQTQAMVALLFPMCIVLICYMGYDKTDNLVTTVAGIAGLVLAMFPCKVSWIPDGTPVGFFSVPIEISKVIHVAASAVFFVMLAINSLFLFPKSRNQTISEGKKFRNRIYRICGIGMFVVMLAILVNRLFFHARYFTFFFEVLLLNLFGISWLVKGKFFGRAQSFFHKTI